MSHEPKPNIGWMQDAILRQADLTLPSTQLCEQCRCYPLRNWFFRRQEKSTHGFVDVPLHTPIIRAWDSVLTNLTECALCFVLLLGLAHDPNFKEGQTFSGVNAQINLSLRLSGLTVIESLDEVDSNATAERIARGWYRKGNELHRGVMYISVTGVDNKYRSFASIDIYPAATSKPSVDDLLCLRPFYDVVTDMQLPKHWLATCEGTHRPVCRNFSWPEMANSALHLIDVQKRCIIKVESQLEYLALSYCWGDIAGRKFLKLTTATLQQLSLDGALSDQDSLLPQTVRDAMLVSERMGFRYLWIDALCIVQDDGIDKQFQIAQMDKVYRHATFTIVAADGPDAWAGLPGVRAGSRKLQQVSRTIGDVDISFRYPMCTVRSIQWSKWASRAWTLQEQIMSTRLLIFRDHEIYWQCNSSLWEEGRNLDSHAFEATRLDGLNLDPSLVIRGDGWSTFQKYCIWMNRISNRDLSMEDDRLRCMQGLINYMTPDSPGGFFWGMPLAAMDSALLYHQGIWKFAPYIRRPGFPSWCWAGWMETTVSSVVGPYDGGFSDNRLDDAGPFGANCPAQPTWVCKEVAWYIVDATDTSWREVETVWIGAKNSFHYLQSKDKWQQNGDISQIDKAKACLARAGLAPSFALACWTQSVFLHVDRTIPDSRDVAPYKDDVRGFDGSKNYHGLVVRDHEGRSIGGIGLDSAYRSSKPDKLYFILIAQNRRWNDKLGPLFDLLHVETIDGITYRVQNIRDATVRPDIWAHLHPEWQFIMMA